ncbi:MAG: hypothetical protein MUF73_13580 [Rhodobacteraceae bacterium]|jgi:hypothetical protein|nr:hypothetical protein [Paracoccaceae bacterium]
MPRYGPVVILVCAALLTAGCAGGPGAGADGAPGDVRLRYGKPDPRGALPEVTLPGTSASETLAFAAERLRAAGFDAVRTDVRGARVTARSSDPAMVDCGTFTQTALGNTARFPGNAPQAVLFAPDLPGGIVTRTVRVATDVTVTLQGPGRASLSTAHEVRASQSQLVAARPWRGQVRFDGDATGTVSDGMTCTGSRAVLDILRGG